MCNIVLPLIRCYHKSVTNFYFTAEPKSAGLISIGEDGRVSVRAAYLQHPDDVRAAVRGISTIIKLVNRLQTDDLLEKASVEGCPIIIVNGLIDLMVKTNVEYRAPKNVESDQTLMSNNSAYQWLLERRNVEMEYFRQQKQSNSNSDEHLNTLEAKEGVRVPSSFMYNLKEKLATYPPTLPGTFF